MNSKTHHPLPSPGKPHLVWVEVWNHEMRNVSDFAHLEPALRPQARCPVCEEVVVLKLGARRAHHAAHRPESTCHAASTKGAKETNDFYDEQKRTETEANARAKANHTVNNGPSNEMMIRDSVATALLIGRVGTNPDVDYRSGRRTVRFPLATHTGPRVQWHHIVADGPLAELAETRIRTGNQVAVEGNILQRHYSDRHGRARVITEIHARQIFSESSPD